MNYNLIVKKNTPKEDRLKNPFNAFLMGGLIGLLGEYLTKFYLIFFNENTSKTCMIITLIFIGCLLTGIGIYDKLVKKFRMGLIIPITGFAHSVMSSTMEYKKEGLVNGIGSNMFKLAGTVIAFGITSSFLVSLIRIIGGII